MNLLRLASIKFQRVLTIRFTIKNRQRTFRRRRVNQRRIHQRNTFRLLTRTLNGVNTDSVLHVTSRMNSRAFTTTNNTFLNGRRHFTRTLRHLRTHFSLTRFSTRAASFRLIVSTVRVVRDTVNTLARRITNTMRRTASITRQINRGTFYNRPQAIRMATNRTHTTRMRLTHRTLQRRIRIDIRRVNTTITSTTTS